MEASKALLAAGVSADVVDENECTPLFLTAASGAAALVPVLVEAGCPVRAADHEGDTALHAAGACPYHRPFLPCFLLLLLALVWGLARRQQSAIKGEHNCMGLGNLVQVSLTPQEGANDVRFAVLSSTTPRTPT